MPQVVVEEVDSSVAIHVLLLGQCETLTNVAMVSIILLVLQGNTKLIN